MTSASTTGSGRSKQEFSAFLENYRASLRHAFHVRSDIDELSCKRGIPPHILRQVRSADPFRVYIPEEFGGRGGHIHEGLAVLAASSYESLALSLTFGINWALFLQPVAKYGHDDVKSPIFRRFLEDKYMGGLMITEPDYGSDALGMQTGYVEHDDHYHVKGLKHWAGLTGQGDYWLLTARERHGDGLRRDIDFFICDVNAPGQHIEVEEYFENLGLYMIPYGRNRIDVEIPKEQRLKPRRTGIMMMLDLLHRSRMQFPGMGMGFLHRLLDEALEHCKQRLVGGKSLFSYDQVQQRLSRIQAAFTVCSAMCAYSSDHAHLKNDLMRNGFEANAIKTVLTDLMQDASQSLLQLVGAKGYRLNHVAGRSTVDSRPFQIFEGSNDILYQQISEAVLKKMRSVKETNLLTYLSSSDLTARAAGYFKDILSFEIDFSLQQRKLVDLGRVLGRMVSLQLVLDLGDRGFRKELIDGAVAVLRQDVAGLLSTYRNAHDKDVVDEYGSESSWLEFVSAPVMASE